MQDAHLIRTYEQADGAWVAYLLDAPHIYAYGRTANEAVSLLFLSLVGV